MSEKTARTAAPTKVLVTNITQKNGGAGYFLDPGEAYGNKLIGPNRSMTVDCPGGHIPEFVQTWGDAVTVHDASTGDLMAGPAAGEISPATLSPVREMTGSQDDDFLNDEGDFDLNDARDAFMPEQSRPISGDLSQMSKPRARVSLGTRSDEVVGGEISPIPGDRPRSLDDSEKYTVRAPRSHAVGAVIGKK